MAKPSAAVLMEQAEAAFFRDLPQLLKEHGHEWVAYHGSQSLGTAPTRAKLYQDCLRRGIPPEELVVWSIEAVIGDVALGPSGVD